MHSNCTGFDTPDMAHLHWRECKMAESARPQLENPMTQSSNPDPNRYVTRDTTPLDVRILGADQVRTVRVTDRAQGRTESGSSLHGFKKARENAIDKLNGKK